MSEWSWYTLGELTHNHNLARRPVKSSDRKPGDTPYYGASGVVDYVDGFTHDGHYLLVSEDGENLRSRSTPIAFEASGRIWVNNHAHVLSGREPFDTPFLRYALSDTDILSHLSGSAQPKLTKASLESIRLRLPTANYRKAIAEVLRAFDDKIAVNNKQLGLIKRLTSALFERAAREPVRDVMTFADVAEVGGGGTPRTSVEEFWGGPIQWATPTDVTGLAAPYLITTARTITEAGLASCPSALYPTGSILMTSRATVGAFAIAQLPVAVNQGFIVTNARDRQFQWWLFHDMRSRVQEFLRFTNGATFLELPRSRFKSLPIRVPKAQAFRRFDDAVTPLHAWAVRLMTENARLGATRDELLPLLMSGKVRVRDVERVAGEVL